jgi:hypothetical protein
MPAATGKEKGMRDIKSAFAGGTIISGNGKKHQEFSDSG